MVDGASTHKCFPFLEGRVEKAADQQPRDDEDDKKYPNGAFKGLKQFFVGVDVFACQKTWKFQIRLTFLVI